MKNFVGRMMVAALAASAVTAANALVFSNITVTGPAAVIGTLGVDHFVQTGATDVDFKFNKAIVGDFQAQRSATINITFEVMGDADCPLVTGVVLSFTGLALGTGFVHVQEIIEDQVNLGIIGSGNLFITPNNPGPVNEMITFTRASSHVKIKKTIFLDAQENPDTFDLAAIGLVEQNLKCVPEPASMAALGLGCAAIAARRRNRK